MAMQRTSADIQATVCLTFDNLGEAAELELGLLPEDVVPGSHRSALTLPDILLTLARHDAPATFFVEGWNAGHYPQVIASMVDAGHEVACHGWRHETWSSLSDTDVTALSDRSLNALRPVAGACVGFRPPGGTMPDGAGAALAERGVEYVSPVGAHPSIDGGLVTLPFEWAEVDALYFEPLMAGARTRAFGDPAVRDAAAWQAALEQAIDRLEAGAEYLNVIFHAYLIADDRDRLDVLDWFVRRCVEHPGITLSRSRDHARRIAAQTLDDREEYS